MADSYYLRQPLVHLDGTPIFKNEADELTENEVAGIIEQAWNCKLHSFGRLSQIDWWAERYGRTVGVLELKARAHLSTRFETVFLNVRKWLALQIAAMGLGVPAIFVVKFEDGIRWVTMGEVDASQHKIGGCVRMTKSRNDIEPVIEVPVSTMKLLPEPSSDSPKVQ